ncbi:conserved hypothetical protein [Vibrio phage 424E50-1]|nr:conserved hypothetical protein [Vibrio phage 424E50-1]CAH9013735.1 conserved hypothetical protein [Vibrio phage 501E54-1]
MSHYSIEVEFLAGTEVYTCYTESVVLCKKLDCAYVKFSFNGIKFSVGCKTIYSEEEVKTKLTECFKKESKYLILN